jgi:hypothetical protein
VDTRGWMGGASRREILSIKPETFFCAVFETAVKKFSLVRFTSRLKGDIPVEGCQGAHSFNPAQTEENVAAHPAVVPGHLGASLPVGPL